jgi:hypothetical protein
MLSFKSSSLAAVLTVALAVPASAAMVGQLSPHSAVKTPVAMSIIPVSDSMDCQMEQGHCEDRCMSAGGSDATMTACFEACQAEADACYDE